MVVCRNVGMYLQANLVWSYRTLGEYSTEQFRHPLSPQNIRFISLGIFCMTTSRSGTLYSSWESSVGQRPDSLYLHTGWSASGLSCVPGDALLTHASSPPFLSTHLRSNKKKFVNYKQRALPNTDIPVPLSRLYLCTPLHTYEHY